MQSKRKLDEQKRSGSEISFITYNLGCLPPILGFYQHNSKILAPNLARAKKFAARILEQADSIDVIALQEVWDISVAKYLENELKSAYPHYVKTDENDNYNGWFLSLRRSGLMLFSKYPIVDVYTHTFDNHMVGEESFSKKALKRYLIQVNESEFITVYNTHLHAQGSLCPPASKWWGGSAQDRRAAQMRAIYEDMQSSATRPPEKAPHLRHLKTVFMGDLNELLNNVEQMLSITPAREGAPSVQVNNIWQYRLLSLFKLTTPENFLDVTAESKHAAAVLREQAKSEGKFTGTDNEGQPSHQAPHALFDAMLVSKEGSSQGKFVSRIISFDEKDSLVSDHFGIMGRFFPHEKMADEPNPYAAAVLEERRERLPPSTCSYLCGNRQRYRNRYVLYPTLKQSESKAEHKDESRARAGLKSQ